MKTRAPSSRLYIDQDLAAGASYDCTSDQANYLLNVLRLASGALLLVFNGRDGEWRAELRVQGRRKCTLVMRELVREQIGGPAIHYLFAPLKKGRLDYMVQKASELGVAALQPVLTSRTNVARVKHERMQANVIEACQQCGVLRVPDLLTPEKLEAVLTNWDKDVPLVFCDEDAEIASPLEALSRLQPGAPIGLLIGPEGGFDDAERAYLRGLPFVHAISLGPRIMRADTAAVAALALVNAVLFDWR